MNLKEFVSQAIRVTRKVLELRRDYHFICDDTFYLYIYYLNKLDDYLSKVFLYDFDTTLTIISDWNPKSPNSVSSSVKNLLISNFFVLKIFQKY